MQPAGMPITRQHVLHLLPIMNLSPEQEARLLSLPYPADISVVAPVFMSLGIDMDILVDRLGGSP